jgi:hypothetical protein
MLKLPIARYIVFKTMWLDPVPQQKGLVTVIQPDGRTI